MGTTELTNLRCEKAKPKAVDYRLADNYGLFLLVTCKGGKSWRWKYRFDGKQKMITYGMYPAVSLAEARKLHMEARAQVEQCIDPMAMRKKARLKKLQKIEAEKKTDSLTFEMLAREWFEWWKEGKEHKYVRQTEHRFAVDIFPVLGQYSPEKITRVDIIQLIQGVNKRGVYDVALRELNHIHQVFEHGMDMGRVKVNPAAGIRPSRILKFHQSANRARVEIQEVPVLLCKIRDYSGNIQTRLAMELCALTFVRTAELLDGRWEEIDWDQKIWKIPGLRMKMKTTHLVPLATQTIALLKRLHRLTGEQEYMFPSINGKRATMCHNTLLRMLEFLGYKKLMTGHGWRGVASTFLHEKGFEDRYIEAQLAHQKRNKTAGAYDYSLYLEARTKMMQFWADALDAMRDSAINEIHLVA